MSIDAIAAIQPDFPLPSWTSPLAAQGASGFQQLVMQGVQHVDDAVRSADAQSAAFAVDDSIPVHQVTLALEQARQSLEMMLQVRSRLVEGYQDTMRMQL